MFWSLHDRYQDCSQCGFDSFEFTQFIASNGMKNVCNLKIGSIILVSGWFWDFEVKVWSLVRKIYICIYDCG